MDVPAKWIAEWEEIKRRAAQGDAGAQVLVELNNRAGQGDEFAADMLYLDELLKLAEEKQMPLAQRVAMVTAEMHKLLMKHGRVKPH